MIDLSQAPGRGRLAGRTAIVVGGGSSAPGIGNGRAAALVLAREGARVTVVDRSAEAAEQTVALIAADGGSAQAVAADATDDEQCRLAVQAAAGPDGPVHVLVNNIGLVGTTASVVDIELAEWDAMMTANVRPFVLVSRYAIPRMIDGGSVINVASIAGIRGTERVQYSASKAAVLGLTNTMAAQHGPGGVRVNAVVPGSVWTPFVKRLTANPAQRDELRARRAHTNMLRAEGTGWDVAYAILFLASDESRWITSQALVVDGGQTKQLAD